ncbi:MAG: SpoVR family protein [Hyphomicrobiales bacterium]|nr:SpoVR family protein [Hyphomicrobiales bacterium]
MARAKAGRPTLKPLFDGAEWDFDTLKHIYDAVEQVGAGELNLDVYPNQIEVITSEQMLDAYASTGMPLMYRHWSFGKHFAREASQYRRGARSLAYELVINSNPCISYVMEENSALMQTLVIAHAAFGHNHFFKNNSLFLQWTNADTIIDYLSFAKDYIAKCEERYGVEAVEAIVDAAHALMRQGVSRQPKRLRALNPTKAAERQERRRAHAEATFNDLWRTVPRAPIDETRLESDDGAEQQALGIPEENLLYFIEKYAPRLEGWQREIIRIVRILSQYFYPQRQTKMMNEGCATYVHYQILHRMHEKGQLNEGAMLEFLHVHSSVLTQPSFDDRRFSGMNPYALGYAMMRDIQRICEEPTQEDYDWFPEIAGRGGALDVLKAAWAEYRDESFILQFLSPKVIRDFRLFALRDEAGERAVEVKAIHDERGYKRIRARLAAQYDVSALDPDIKVTDADLSGARRLTLTHSVRNGVMLDRNDCDRTLRYVAQLWGYRVKLIEQDAATDKILREQEALPMP